jgi:HK97 family phage portal protein
MPIQAGEYERFAPIYACVAIIAQDMSRIPLNHVRTVDGREEKVYTTAASRLFRKPNSYQTRSDFALFLMRSLLLDGNAYAIVGGRNQRGEITSLYPITPTMIWPHIEPGSGEYFYRIGQDASTELAAWDPTVPWLPPEDVLHIRLQTPRHPLIGESPLVAALYPTMAGTQINAHTAAFFSNMSRPSGILRHPGRLKPEAMSRIKERWMQLTQGPSTGEPAVLAEGMEWQQLQMTAVDAELAKSYELSERQIFQIYRVPPFLGGDLQKATFTNVESLTRFYLQSCLGFYVDHLEEALTLFFDLPPSEHILFDLEPALLRGDIKERMEAYGKAIQNGVFSPNEARQKENLPPAADGDQPRVQQQLVPLSYGMAIQPPTQGAAQDTAQGEPEEDETEEPEEEPAEGTEEDKAMYMEQTQKGYLHELIGVA